MGSRTVGDSTFQPMVFHLPPPPYAASTTGVFSTTVRAAQEPISRYSRLPWHPFRYGIRDTPLPVTNNMVAACSCVVVNIVAVCRDCGIAGVVEGSVAFYLAFLYYPATTCHFLTHNPYLYAYLPTCGALPASL